MKIGILKFRLNFSEACCFLKRNSCWKEGIFSVDKKSPVIQFTSQRKMGCLIFRQLWIQLSVSEVSEWLRAAEQDWQSIRSAKRNFSLSLLPKGKKLFGIKNSNTLFSPFKNKPMLAQFVSFFHNTVYKQLYKHCHWATEPPKEVDSLVVPTTYY